MNLLANLPEKHRTDVTYLIICVMIGIMLYFMWLESVVGILVTLVILCWFVKGGGMGFNLFHILRVWLDDGEYKRNRSVPMTDLRDAFVKKKKGEVFGRNLE